MSPYIIPNIDLWCKGDKYDTTKMKCIPVYLYMFQIHSETPTLNIWQNTDQKYWTWKKQQQFLNMCYKEIKIWNIKMTYLNSSVYVAQMNVFTFGLYCRNVSKMKNCWYSKTASLGDSFSDDDGEIIASTMSITRVTNFSCTKRPYTSQNMSKKNRSYPKVPLKKS